MLNPEVGHEQMSSLNFYHVVAQAIQAGKLFTSISTIKKDRALIKTFVSDLNRSRNLFFVVRLLEESYQWICCWACAKVTSLHLEVAKRNRG